MDIYYIDTIEQTVAPEDFDYTVNEYGKREQWKLSYEEVLAKFYKKLSDVSNDLVPIGEGKKHYYMDIKIVNSDGGVEKKDKVGTRQPVEPVSKPEENVEEG